MSYEGEVKRKSTGRNDSMDPRGQSYLPGYFCPAALIHSREITQDMGRVDTGIETQRLVFLRLTKGNRNKMHDYDYNGKTTLTGTTTKLWATFTIYWIAHAAGWVIWTGNIHKRQANQTIVTQEA